MIDSDKFKKILHILKTNAKDLNINISIIDYDTSRECDYETITLHLKETNTQTGAVVYKDFIIRSQVYYDVEDKLYLSALDGDIVIENGAFSKIQILDRINEFKTFEHYKVKVKLVDSETNDSIRNQLLFLHFTSSPNYIASATTDRDGIAVFSFRLKDTPVTVGEQLLYVRYNGNAVYRKASSDMLVVNVIDENSERTDSMPSSVTAKFIVDDRNIARILYSISFNGDTLSDGFYKIFNDESTMDPPAVEELLSGRVFFYIDDAIVGESFLYNDIRKTCSEITVPFSDELFGKNVSVHAVFEGNEFFPLNMAKTDVYVDRVDAENILFSINEEGVDRYSVSVGFDVSDVFPDSDISSDIRDSVLLHLQTSSAYLYIYDSNGALVPDPIFKMPSDEYDWVIEHIGSAYQISLPIEIVPLHKQDYGFGDDDPFRVKLSYDGNGLIGPFDVEKIVGA